MTLKFNDRIKKYLDKHGYQLVTTDVAVEIRYVRGFQNAIIALGLFTAFIFTIIGLAKPLLGFSAATISVLLAIIWGLKIKGSMIFMLDFHNDKVKISDKIYTSFHYISHISLESQYTDEYSSADKLTSEVYTHSLKLITEAGVPFLIFEFEEDYLEPSEDLNLLYMAIKDAIPRIR